MFAEFPKTAQEAFDWSWERYKPYLDDLSERDLNAGTLAEWMADWTRVSRLIGEVYARQYVATTLNTKDEAAQKAFNRFLEEIFPNAMAAEQVLKEKLLASGLEPRDFSVQLRNMRADDAIFRDANLPLLSKEHMLGNEYDQIVGAQTVEWDGEEVTLPKLQPVYQDPDRARREKAWRLGMGRWQQDREAINELWGRFMDLRADIAKNADFDEYRSYRWQQLHRLDYTPEDCLRFHESIEKVVVPAAQRIYARRQEKLGLESLRPWDLDVDVADRPPLRPYQDVDELKTKGLAMFNKVDPELGRQFATMLEEELLDLENVKGKAPGAYCIDYAMSERPFIFMNAVGLHDDVQTLLHETGHAFHCFATSKLPYSQQAEYSPEIAEVASMSMELLAAPYLPESEGGFYSDADAARARIEHLESLINFWPYMAVVDAFQHWVYTNHKAATDPANCDAQWARLWERFMVGIDYSGLEDVQMTGWQRKLHIHQIPFYYVDYGLAQLGATLVWKNAQTDQAGAVAAYRYALSLGATRTLPELFEAAGAKLAFDAETLGGAVGLIEETLERLEAV